MLACVVFRTRIYGINSNRYAPFLLITNSFKIYYKELNNFSLDTSVKLFTIELMGKIELPSMANTSTVCYTISHDDLIDFANVIIQKSQEVAEQQSANHESQEEYLTRKEVMAIMKRCDSTMTKWARTGYLEPVRVGGKHLYRKSDVEKLMSH